MSNKSKLLSPHVAYNKLFKQVQSIDGNIRKASQIQRVALRNRSRRHHVSVPRAQIRTRTTNQSDHEKFTLCQGRCHDGTGIYDCKHLKQFKRNVLF